MGRLDQLKAEESFPIQEQDYTRKLLGGTERQKLLYMGVSKSFMSKTHYLFITKSCI